ncbi:MAG TPA: hypothetical protein VNH64_10740 [Parvularculaceae bacterium]|nr:hypothetical protein [Parvularculaceae bacterium]
MTTFVRDSAGGAVRLHALCSRESGQVKAALAGPCGNVDPAALGSAIERYVEGDYSFERPFFDCAPQNLAFNVMPDKAVEERIAPRVYFVGRDIARTVFDRQYETRMDKSPSHVIFLSALVQWQKLIYLIMCHRCGVDYDAAAPEAFKIWPTEVHCRMPALVREESNLTQDCFVSRLDSGGEGVWRIEGFAIVNKRMGLVGRALVHRI